MTSLLVADHGVVNAAGHAFPLAEGYASLPEEPQSEGKFKKIKTQLEGAIESKSVTTAELPKVGLVYAVVLSFSDEPRDAVAILVNPEGRIVRLLWTII